MLGGGPEWPAEPTKGTTMNLPPTTRAEILAGADMVDLAVASIAAAIFELCSAAGELDHVRDHLRSHLRDLSELAEAVRQRGLAA